MAERTSIEWCDATWSPWEGCQKVGPGCDHCYAEGMNRWLRKGENWGPGAPRREYSDAHWAKPLKWNAAAKAAGVRMRVFPSVCDPFDNAVAPEWRARFFDLIGRTSSLDWLLLTKRIGNAADMLPWMPEGGVNSLMASSELWPNIWLGATVVNQEEADRDIPKLLATPARIRFLSMEPLLGPVTLPGFNANTSWCPVCKAIVPDSLFAMHENTHGPGLVDQPFNPALHCSSVYDLINWIIVGGESGAGARPMHPEWARSLRDQCDAAGVPFLFKQWGEWAPYDRGHVDSHALATPGSLDTPLQKFGKKLAGRQLDGVTHDGFPEAR